MKIKLSEIPTLLSDHFQYENSYKATGIYFWCRIDDGIVDTGYAYGWTPIGKSKNKSLISEHNDIVIMFENDEGEKTWFHLAEWTSDDV